MKLDGATWHKSIRSGSEGNCVEVALDLPGVVAVRDTKNRERGALVVGRSAWTDFLAGLKAGEFDL